MISSPTMPTFFRVVTSSVITSSQNDYILYELLDWLGSVITFKPSFDFSTSTMATECGLGRSWKPKVKPNLSVDTPKLTSYHMWSPIETVIYVTWVSKSPADGFDFFTSGDLLKRNRNRQWKYLFPRWTIKTGRGMTSSNFDLLFDLVTSSMTSWVRGA